MCSQFKKLYWLTDMFTSSTSSAIDYAATIRVRSKEESLFNCPWLWAVLDVSYLPLLADKNLSGPCLSWQCLPWGSLPWRSLRGRQHAWGCTSWDQCFLLVKNIWNHFNICMLLRTEVEELSPYSSMNWSKGAVACGILYLSWRCISLVLIFGTSFQKLFVPTELPLALLLCFNTAKHSLLTTRITWILFCNWAAKSDFLISSLRPGFFLPCCALWVDSPCCLRPRTTTGCSAVQLAPGMDMCPNPVQMRMRPT